MYYLLAATANFDASTLIVAIIATIGTLGAAFFAFKGKTQDTANWLIKELREEVHAARDSAKACEAHRAEDRLVMEELRSMLAGLQSGLRSLKAENDDLRKELGLLRTRVTGEVDLTSGPITQAGSDS
jgi:hypothetical protein